MQTGPDSASCSVSAGPHCLLCELASSWRKGRAWGLWWTILGVGDVGCGYLAINAPRPVSTTGRHLNHSVCASDQLGLWQAQPREYWLQIKTSDLPMQVGLSLLYSGLSMCPLNVKWWSKFIFSGWRWLGSWISCDSDGTDTTSQVCFTQAWP